MGGSENFLSITQHLGRKAVTCNMESYWRQYYCRGFQEDNIEKYILRHTWFVDSSFSELLKEQNLAIQTNLGLRIKMQKNNRKTEMYAQVLLLCCLCCFKIEPQFST